MSRKGLCIIKVAVITTIEQPKVVLQYVTNALPNIQCKYTSIPTMSRDKTDKANKLTIPIFAQFGSQSHISMEKF